MIYDVEEMVLSKDENEVYVLYFINLDNEEDSFMLQFQPEVTTIPMMR